MALAPEETLGTIRKEVLIRSGMSADGTHPTGGVALIDSFIRSAQKLLYEQAWWVRNKVSKSITLIEGEDEYEIPDDVHLGSMTEVVAVDDQDNEVPLENGIRSVDRMDTNGNGAPLLFDIIDGVLRILPAPESNWERIDFKCTTRVPPFVDPSERAVVDSEALIQAAVIRTKSHYEMPGLALDIAVHKEYLDSVRANQSQGTGFTVGGAKSAKTRGTPVRRIGRNPGSATDNWQPW